jgi:hypothetical protein
MNKNYTHVQLSLDESYSAIVYWGDGDKSEIIYSKNVDITHTYANPGTYDVEIKTQKVFDDFTISSEDKVENDQK